MLKIWRKKGFALGELLVVIAIIAILAAVLVPALDQAKEKARQAQCVSNMNKIISAWQMYVDDHKGYLPAYSNGAWGASGDSLRPWSVLMRTYLNEPDMKDERWASYNPKGILRCPSVEVSTANYSSWYTCYGMNQFAIGGGDSGNYSGYREQSQIKRPSEQLVFTDSKYPKPDSPEFGDGYYITRGDKPNAGWVYVRFAHTDRANVAYADGHVEARTDEQLYISNWEDTTPWGWPDYSTKGN